MTSSDSCVNCEWTVRLVQNENHPGFMVMPGLNWVFGLLMCNFPHCFAVHRCFSVSQTVKAIEQFGAVIEELLVKHGKRIIGKLTLCSAKELCLSEFVCSVAVEQTTKSTQQALTFFR